MLDELHVRDIALIEEASIVFSPGLTVLTGETGAGKTALLTALGLIRGQRADAASVRDGADEAVVEARLLDGQEEHVVRRRVLAKGRSRCTVDGQMATVAELAQACSGVRVHGQNEQSQLVSAAVQLSLLDRWIDPQEHHLDAYRAALADYRAAADELASFEAAREKALRELEFMRFTAAEIEKVNPVEGELEALEADLPRMQNAEQLAQAVGSALSALADDGAALDALASAARHLGREEGIDAELDGIADRLASLLDQLEDAARDLRSYSNAIVFDPVALEDTLSRLDALSGLMKRFGPGMDGVLATWNEARAAVESAESSPERHGELVERRSVALEHLREQGGEVHRVHQQAAGEFCSRLAQAVGELAMKGAGFEFSFAELPVERWTDAGPEHAELLYQPAPASAARPLSRIASGGELSRISLAIECLDRSRDAAAGVTLVFDEVDQGVGGATGAAVARALAELSKSAQVVVVTHLPQVAAVADAHYVVSKETTPRGEAVTDVSPVAGDARVAELARMLAGSTDDTALEHARALLEAAGGAA